MAEENPVMTVAERVREMADDVGTTVVFKRVTPGAFNAATGKSAAATTYSYSVKVTIRDFKPHQIKGLIQDGDRRVILPANGLSFTPDKNDQIFIGGVRHNIMHIETVYAREDVAAYRILVRGGNG